ncbi:MAG TPA: autotransporter assembly complex family protein [Geminicoccaceae bacterium]|nr:autotransporter assembly complex family protein [Geminicoccaceae bacterium]
MRALARAALVLLGLAAAAAAQDDERLGREPDGLGAEPPAAEAEDPGPRVPYRVEFEGVTEGALRELLEAVSETRATVDRPPPSVAALRRRAQTDVPRLLQALRSRGFYDAQVEPRVDAAASPARVVFDVRPGEPYRLRDVTVETVPPESTFVPPAAAELGLRPGEPAAARPILDAEAALLERARRQGYALARTADRTAAIERGANAMDLTLRIEPGAQARVGQIRFEGLDEVEESFVRRRVQVGTGEIYDPERLAEARQALVDSGLFAAVRVRLGEELSPGNHLPVTFELRERLHRSIGAGVRYRTDEGLGGNVSWEHRNFFRRGERVRIEADVSGFGTTVSNAFELSASFRKPDVFDIDQTLVAETSVNTVDTEAFESSSIGASLGLERVLSPRTEAGVAVAFRAAEVTTPEDTESFGLISLPAFFSRDTSDDLLDPSEGGRVRLDAAPFADTFGTGVTFARSSVRYAHYYQAIDEPRIVLAGRVALGGLFGADLEDVPADERFYAGGGGSVRGFGFQLAGPLDDEGNPTGGRSLLELSGEVRFRVTETIGGVTFLDAGSAFESTLPDFGEDLRLGTGVGVRYFTPIGPLRLDVAVPLNRRDVDDAFQLYISIGQAF